ncbi:MAG: NAD(P)-dependent alcohol dehydrogenase [Rhodobacteraceae bacterium]|nr:NAD(P)-dependent alcohol dehydrogenase [Paracoccaceae bacterium]
MQAYIYTQYGPPEVLKMVEIPTPKPGENEVLIKTYATTVSSGDWRARSLTVPAGLGLIARLVFGISRPRKPVLGTELSGVICEIGAKVTDYKTGDAVIAFPGAGFGAHAEYCLMPQDGALVIKPQNLSFAEAAALPFGGTTAYDFLINKAKLQPGEHVLINGASGSTGTAFVQLAKHFGATVTAVCSRANSGLVRSLGADQVIDYHSTDFFGQPRKYDIIVDTAGTAPWARAKKSLASNGRLVIVNGSLSDMVFGPLRARLSGKRLVGGVAGETKALLQHLAELAAAGKFRPVIDRSYSFEQMVKAHTHVDTGHKKGNVVVVLIRASD